MNFIKSLLIWLIGICLVIILFPITFLVWLITFPFDTKKSAIHWFLVFQSIIICQLIPAKIIIRGREKAIKGTTYVIISNHRSIIDILVINCLRYRFRWISKIENMKVPVLGWYLKMTGYITVNRNNDESKVEMLSKSLDCLKNGTSIMIFPEGTRSPDVDTGFFKRGAFQLAIDAVVPILPIVINGTGDILPKNGFIFRGRHTITVQVLDPVPPSDFGTTSAEELALKFNALISRGLKEVRAQSPKV